MVAIDPVPSASPGPTAEHFDVVIVGAGISGVGGAYHLARQCPERSFVVLESQESFGGTWRTHTYPGIRSDSDLYTFGYRFKPWAGPPIATADEILAYMAEVLEENDLERHIRYDHTITEASWSSDERCWTLLARGSDEVGEVRFTTPFLWMCQGYYRHSAGYTPHWDGIEDFAGQVVHPQSWPADLDYAGKRVVVVGSGATAATLVPAMAPACGHITMLQRSPTFFVARPNRNELADTLRDLGVREDWVHEIARRQTLRLQEMVTELSVDQPELVRTVLIEEARARVGPDCDVDTHFNPGYRPWQQRLALLPDGDLFEAVRTGKASVVTDTIDRFTERGILLGSGDELEADIVVTATGFDLNVLGDITFTVDGEPLNFHETVTYRGAMFTGVPNLLWVFGYFRASWTLRADLLADFVCRLLHHMDDLGAQVVVPRLRDEDAEMTLRPWVEPSNFNPGYLARGMHLMPRQGDRAPWLHTQDYWADRHELPAADLDDGTLVFG